MKNFRPLSLLLLLPLVRCAALADNKPIQPKPALTVSPWGATWGTVTHERIAALPGAEKALWEAYLQRSEALHNVEATQLEAEARGVKPVAAYKGADFKMKSGWSGAWFSSEEAKTLTEAVLSFQTPTGGWSKAVDYTKGSRQLGMQWTSQVEPFHYAATIDNRSTTEQLGFLNQVYAASPSATVKTAIERGLDYLLIAQYPNGGWPQTFPLEGGYHDGVTYNDNAMLHVMVLMDDVASAPQWTWLDAGRRSKAKAASANGLDYVLKSQYVQNGLKTVWCAQHDPLTYVPVGARRQEPVSLSGGETVDLVRYLMGLPDQTPPVVSSIEAALAWFEKSKIIDMKLVSRNGKKAYQHEDTPQSPLWARFYDLKTNAPLFSGGKDGIVYTSYEALSAHNDGSGYDYYVNKPQDLITKDAVKWRKRLGK